MDNEYPGINGVKSLRSLLSLIVSEINNNKLYTNFKVSVNFIMGSFGLEVKKGSNISNSLLELLLSIDEDFVFGFDELQELSQASKYFLDILGNVFASNNKVRFIFFWLLCRHRQGFIRVKA